VSAIEWADILTQRIADRTLAASGPVTEALIRQAAEETITDAIDQAVREERFRLTASLQHIEDTLKRFRLGIG
jgi:hypothetical protein